MSDTLSRLVREAYQIKGRSIERDGIKTGGSQLEAERLRRRLMGQHLNGGKSRRFRKSGPSDPGPSPLARY